jgi:hypothetical protein
MFCMINGINQLLVVLEIYCVYYEVETEFLCDVRHWLAKDRCCFLLQYCAEMNFVFQYCILL